jgi:hypothetical protein
MLKSFSVRGQPWDAELTSGAARWSASATTPSGSRKTIRRAEMISPLAGCFVGRSNRQRGRSKRERWSAQRLFRPAGKRRLKLRRKGPKKRGSGENSRSRGERRTKLRKRPTVCVRRLARRLRPSGALIPFTARSVNRKWQNARTGQWRGSSSSADHFLADLRRSDRAIGRQALNDVPDCRHLHRQPCAPRVAGAASGTDEIMAEIVAGRLVEHLERAGFVVMKRPAAVGAAALGRGFEGQSSGKVSGDMENWAWGDMRNWTASE